MPQNGTWPGVWRRKCPCDCRHPTPHANVLWKLICYQYIKPIRNIILTTTKSPLIQMFGVLFNLLALVRTPHFCMHPQDMLSQATLPVSLTKDYGHFLRRGLNTDFHPGLILLNARVLSREHFRHIANDGVKRKASECMPLTTRKINFYALLT